MTRKFLPILTLYILLCQNLHAQDSIPILTGKVNISILNGTFDCDLTLKNIPRIQDYYIRINSGMNILNFRSVAPNDFLLRSSYVHEEDSLSTGEAHAYFFKDNTGKGKFLPQTVEVKYVGKYPVVKDTLNNDYSRWDWKGNIAFNGYSVRTDGLQTAWYPYLYDIKKDKAYDQMKYDIELTCNDCSTLYVNGNLPVKGTRAHFKSDIPQQLSLFCGNYKVANVNGTYLLNPDIDEKQIEEFGNITNSYKKFYEEHLSIPYKQAITYVQTTPLSTRNAWLFVSYPTIFNIGYGQYGMKSFFDQKKGDWFKPYIAHELGHYYFGTYKVFNSDLGDMMSEGFAEYLSLQITKNLISDSIYNKKISDKITALKDFSAIPFFKIKSKSDYINRELYVYYYAPIIFTAIEKEIGEENMWKWLKAILEATTDFTNYAFLEQTLGSVLHDNEKLALIRSKYFDTDNSVENAKKLLVL